MERFADRHFKALSGLVYEYCGINYHSEKRDLLAGRALKAAVKFGIDSWDEFLLEIGNRKNTALLQEFINNITVNQTDFFRENPHFDFVLQNMQLLESSNPSFRAAGELRAWSAACSSGEEVYTLAMVLKEALDSRLDFRVLGTDIDSNMIRRSQQGCYKMSDLLDVPKQYSARYFSREGDSCIVSDEIRKAVSFRLFNLMEAFPFKKKFDVVFCRNVMIYFDHRTQAKLIEKIYAVMNTGGILFVGHSETLPDKSVRFKYLMPAVYMKY